MNYEEYANWRRSVDYYPEEEAFDCYVLGLASEAGEVAGKLKKEIRDGVDYTDAMYDELSDVLWYLQALLDEFDSNIYELMAYNHNKIEGRKAKGTIQGDGDRR